MDAFPYRIVTEWSQEDEVFIARVPAVGAQGHCPSPEKAAREARLAADAMLEVLREEGEPVPEPDTSTDYSGRVLLRLPRWLHGALARKAKEDGVSLNQEMVSLLAALVGKETSRG